MRSSALNALSIVMSLVVAAVVLATATVVGAALADLRRGAPGGALSGTSPSPIPAMAIARPIPWSGRVAPSWTPAPTPAPRPLAGVRICEPRDLVGRVGTGAGLGTVYSGIRLANASASPCQLFGAPHVAAIDASGAVRATIDPAGGDFPATPPILLAPGHGVPPADAPARAGDAVLLIAWVAWCGDPVRVSAFRIDLATGPLLLPLQPEAGSAGEVTFQPRCDMGPNLQKTPSLRVADFRPNDPKPYPTPAPPPLVLSARIDAPSRIDDNAGTLRYTVTLTNATSATYTFGSCPIFAETFVKNFRRYYLPCEAVLSLAPGASATLAMELPLDPRFTPPGEVANLRWWLDPPLDGASATARIDIATRALGTPAP